MKIHAVYDAAGKIIAAIEVDPDLHGASGITLRPVPGEGHKSGEFSVPAQDSAISFEDVCRTFKIDVRSATPGLVKAGG